MYDFYPDYQPRAMLGLGQDPAELELALQALPSEGTE